MRSVPSKSHTTHQVEVIRRIDIVFVNAQILCQTTHHLFQYQELRIRSRAATVYTMEISSAPFQVLLNGIPKLRMHIGFLSSLFILIRLWLRWTRYRLTWQRSRLVRRLASCQDARRLTRMCVCMNMPNQPVLTCR
jgi:hypothetical protein